jgi:hypothetical protein
MPCSSMPLARPHARARREMFARTQSLARRIALIGTAIAGTASSLLAQVPCASDVDKTYVTDVGSVKSLAKPLKANGEEKLINLASGDELRHIRMRLKLSGQPPEEWRLSVYGGADADWAPQQIIGPSSFQNGARTIWSKRFEGGKVKTILHTQQSSPQQFLEIDAANLMQTEAKVTYYSVGNKSDLKWQCLVCPTMPMQKVVCGQDKISCTATPLSERRRGEGVAMAMVFGPNAAWTCSGFLIAPDLFLTNWHCGGSKDTGIDVYWDADTLRNTYIDFSWDGDDISNEYQWSGFPVVPAHGTEGAQNVLKNRDLDYAIFSIRPLLQSIGPPPVTPIRATATLAEGAPLRVIHHPLSRVKSLTEKSCKVERVNYPSWVDKKADVDFLHKCDTEGGSSGAPIFDAGGFVVGVHHSGHTATEGGGCDGSNKAVKIERIYNSLPEVLKTKIKIWN